MEFLHAFPASMDAAWPCLGMAPSLTLHLLLEHGVQAALCLDSPRLWRPLELASPRSPGRDFLRGRAWAVLLLLSPQPTGACSIRREQARLGVLSTVWSRLL